MLEINLVDIFAGIVTLLFLVRGLIRGLAREVGSVLGIVGGFFLARHFQSSVQPALEPLFPNHPDMAAIAAFALILVATIIGVALLVFALRKFMSVTLTSWVDHFLGAFGGLAKGLLLLTVMFYLAQGLFPDLDVIKTAQCTPLFESLADYLRSFLPDAFSSYKLPVRL